MFRRWFFYFFVLFVLISLIRFLVNLVYFFGLFLLILLGDDNLLGFSRFLRMTCLLPSRSSAYFCFSCHSVWILFLMNWYNLLLMLLLEIRCFIFIVSVCWIILILWLVILSIGNVLRRYLRLFLFWNNFTTWKWRLVKWFWSSWTLFPSTFTCLAFVISW